MSNTQPISFNTLNCYTVNTFRAEDILIRRDDHMEFTAEAKEAAERYWDGLGEPVSILLEEAHTGCIAEVTWDWGLTRPRRFIKITAIPAAWEDLVCYMDQRQQYRPGKRMPLR